MSDEQSELLRGTGASPSTAKIIKLREVRLFASVMPRTLYSRSRVRNEAIRAIRTLVGDGEYFAFESNPTVVLRLTHDLAYQMLRTGDQRWTITDVQTQEEETIEDPGPRMEQYVTTIPTGLWGGAMKLGTHIKQAVTERFETADGYIEKSKRELKEAR
ncbi:MAG: hypothetical protein ACXWZ7_17640 [Gemmatirosa sp.]